MAKTLARHYDRWKMEAAYEQVPIHDSNRV